jgi:hypothetical protein
MKSLLGRILWLPLVLLLLARGQVAAGTWTNISSLASSGIGPMLLLSDGTVFAQDFGNTNWYRLTPDPLGSYVNGAWTSNAPMKYVRQYYASAVLPDGRVFAAGAEYGSGTTNVEVYDPLSDSWTQIPIPPGLITTNNTIDPVTGANTAGFRDSGCVVVADGKVLASPVYPTTNGGTVLFDPKSNTMLLGPT